MNLRTLLGYFFGSRQAIEAIAYAPKAVWLGALFVLSAGFAREYDGVDLLQEPGHVFVPLGVSLPTSFLLFCLLMPALRPQRSAAAGFWRAYWSFLGLYWMTAPLAWLYAIPVERFLSPLGAMQANLWLLAVVSAWRVLLMIRVVSVLFAVRLLHSFCVVMFFADSVAVVALTVTECSLVSLMSGARLSDSEALLRQTTELACWFSLVTWPLWFLLCLGAAMSAGWLKRKPRLLELPRGKVSWSLWALAAFSLVIWAFILPITQAEQRRASEARIMVRRGPLVEAMRWMSQHEPGDFPPSWEPPPRPQAEERQPGVLAIVESLIEADAAPWVRELYLDKIERVLQLNQSHFEVTEDLKRVGYERFVQLLEQMPEGREFMKRNEEQMRLLKMHLDSLKRDP